MCYSQSSSSDAVGISEGSEQNFVTKYIHGVCTTCTCTCPINYPKPSPRGLNRSNSEWMFTIEYYYMYHVGTRKEKVVTKLRLNKLGFEVKGVFWRPINQDQVLITWS